MNKRLPAETAAKMDALLPAIPAKAFKRDPKHRKVVAQHPALLARFGTEHNDPLVADLLVDDVKPIPFPSNAGVAPPPGKSKKGKAK